MKTPVGKIIEEEKQQDYFRKILSDIENIKNTGQTVYPKSSDIFNAFKLTPLDEIKVVILGQDPYHGPNQAHGLCFSVLPPTPPPPSLKNIFKELQSENLMSMPEHGCLTSWARQGVFLLNTVLTVEAHQANSHAKLGWQRFTDKVISVINDTRDDVVFMLWGSQAQRKAEHLDHNKHYILKSTHPSPLSAHRGFIGCQHFSKANEYLKQHGKKPISWNLPSLASLKK